MDAPKYQISNQLTGLLFSPTNLSSINNSGGFFKSVIDALPDNIVIINETGDIQFTNQSWDNFAKKNGGPDDFEWGKYNYFNVCSAAAAAGDTFGSKAAKGIKGVIKGEDESFYLEYPCHSAKEKRWFIMRIKPLTFETTTYYLITHHDITKRKLIEDKILNLSRIDPLTNIANRRAFDDFLSFQWKHCNRYKTPITLATIDIDNFKMLNDTYGHIIGDQCLQKIGNTLKHVTKRPDDLCARLGGEEFAIIFGSTNADQCIHVINKLFEKIAKLKMPNEKSPVSPFVTISVGISSIIPNVQYSIKELIYESDQQLYAAKKAGRNQISVQSDPTKKH